MKRSTRRYAGFTLTELLVATALLSIVMTAVYTLFHSAVGSWRRVEDDFDTYQQARMAMSTMKREVHSLLRSTGALFEGKDDEFTMFVVAEPFDVEEALGRQVMRVRYYLSSKGLMREEAIVKSPLPIMVKPGEEGRLDSRVKFGREEKFLIAKGVQEFNVWYVWTPLVEREHNQPPLPPAHIRVQEHHQTWGFPQALEIDLVLQDPEAPEQSLHVRHLIPIQVAVPGRLERYLNDMLREVL